MRDLERDLVTVETCWRTSKASSA